MAFNRAIFPENTATGTSVEFTQPGKTYGPRAVGDVSGKYKTFGEVQEMVFELTPGALTNVPAQILDGEYLVEGITLSVSTAFAAGTADLSIGGGAGLTTDLDLTTKGVSDVALTGLANTAGTGPVAVTLTAAGVTGTAGHAEVVVKYKKV